MPNKQLEQQRKFDTTTTQYRSTSTYYVPVVSLGVLTKMAFLKLPFLRVETISPVYVQFPSLEKFLRALMLKTGTSILQ